MVSFEELTGLRAEGFAEFEADLRVEEFGEGKMYGKEGGEVAEVGEEFEVVGDDFLGENESIELVFAVWIRNDWSARSPAQSEATIIGREHECASEREQRRITRNADESKEFIGFATRTRILTPNRSRDDERSYDSRTYPLSLLANNLSPLLRQLLRT